MRRVLIKLVGENEELPTLHFPSSYRHVPSGDIVECIRITTARLEHGRGWENEELLLIWDVAGASLWWSIAYDAVAKAKTVAEACGITIYRVGNAEFYHVTRPLSRLVETRVGRVVALESGHALIPVDTATYLKYTTTTVAASGGPIFAAALVIDDHVELVAVSASCTSRITLGPGDYIAVAKG